jgi:hypothetical protein
MRSPNFVPGIAGKPAHFVAPLYAKGIVTIEGIRHTVGEQVAACVSTLCGRHYQEAKGYGLDGSEAAKYARACNRN